MARKLPAGRPNMVPTYYLLALAKQKDILLTAHADWFMQVFLCRCKRCTQSWRIGRLRPILQRITYRAITAASGVAKNPLRERPHSVLIAEECGADACAALELEMMAVAAHLRAFSDHIATYVPKSHAQGVGREFDQGIG